MPVQRTDNLDEAQAAIEGALSTGLHEAAQAEKENVEKNWDKNRDALGRPWKELSPITILNKGHASILEESGDMRGANFVRRTGPFSVVLGNSDSKIGIHEMGTETVPQRPVIQPALTHLRTELLQSTLVRRISRAIMALNLRAVFS
ncbi:hypothetical protein [Saliphagus sp. LR7]|uniref:hypothetical protein n=1 Tax=Saliphagus sp. LR7 TaxID=2282654 RepID=UPI000DF752A2|nr:hypothetical protein [Saliphagus sp. LR7]